VSVVHSVLRWGVEVELSQLPDRVDRLEGAVADDLNVGAQVLELDVLLGRGETVCWSRRGGWVIAERARRFSTKTWRIGKGSEPKDETRPT
jgi:putative component of toxin-antitoxin plasmid stabilization module